MSGTTPGQARTPGEELRAKWFKARFGNLPPKGSFALLSAGDRNAWEHIAATGPGHWTQKLGPVVACDHAQPAPELADVRERAEWYESERNRMRELVTEILCTYAGDTGKPGVLTSLASPDQRNRWRERAGLGDAAPAAEPLPRRVPGAALADVPDRGTAENAP